MSDDIIWRVINHQFCSFKLKTGKDQNFCRNEYNVSGLCNRSSCPLANSKYATVRSIDGKLYLYMKTAERAHMPSKLWERVKLSKNYQTALQQIDDNLVYWNKFLIHKCKQRMTRYFQVATRERRLAKQVNERELVSKQAPKVKRREQTRERKALAAGKVEKAIEKELLDRLKSGAYGEQPLNVDENVWKTVLKNMQKNNELQEDDERDEQDEEEDEEEEEMEMDEEQEEEDDEDVGNIEYVEADENDDDEMVQLEDLEKWLGSDSDAASASASDSGSGSDSDNDGDDDKDKKQQPRKPLRKKPRVEIEYEQEHEPAQTEKH